jgi:23S rRNA pseudouridine1911/1915/1917 synthase
MKLETPSVAFLTPDWPVLYEDNHLLGLYKPAGLLVQGDSTGDPNLLDLARDWLKDRYAKPGRVFLGLVHRLDRPVAGVVLFARTSKAAGRLSGQFRSRTVRKRYLAVLEGRLRPESGTMEHRIRREPEGGASIGHAGDPEAKEARLNYRVLDSAGGRCLVEVDLETGRRHQIRLQFAWTGHPLLGDTRYGASAPLPHRRLALLASELTVTHPTQKDTIVLKSPLPVGWPWPGTDDRQQVPWDWSVLARRF